MTWTPKLTQLNDALSDLVPDKKSITRFVKSSGLKPQFIDTDGNAMDVWSNVLSEADKNNMVDDLVKAVLDTYPDNPYLKSALSEKELNYALGPELDITNWKESIDELEVLTSQRSTLLPISFLAKGVQTSKAVAKVEIKRSSKVTDVGTGFLFKLVDSDDVLFMTNNHVISDQEDITKTRIIFDYELDIEGDTLPSESFKIDPKGPWYTSSVTEYDVTIFKLIDEENKLDEFGYLELNEISTEKDDFVNIIQHPGGQLKQISLYHNIVTHTDDRIVQYLTDTLKGSSGAPVFNSDWEVVALHHSGGKSKPWEPPLPTGIKSRNEGISITPIIQFIKENYAL